MRFRVILTAAFAGLATVAAAAAVIFLLHAPPAAPDAPTLTITGDPHQ